MGELNRRDFVAAGLLGAAGARPAWSGVAEPGATLRVMRWKRFVAGDEALWMQNTQKFSEQYKVRVAVDSESFEDIRPKAAVAASVGKGPDIVLGWYDDAHLYPDKLVPLTDVADYLGRKYGGWYEVCRAYGMRGREWIGLPIGASGSAMVYRSSHLKAAGFERFPATTTDYLKFAQAMHARGTPVAHALGHANGDATVWCHWLVWSHGGQMVDEKGNVTIQRPETIAALEYAKQLCATFPPGTLSWLDPSNNKAFLDGHISCTNNAISIYYVARHSSDARLKAMAEDIDHADWPVGPVGQPTQLHQITQAMVFKHTRYPKAAKEYLRFMMEEEQYLPWQSASLGYVVQPLKAYASGPVWTQEPKAAAFRDGLAKMRHHGHAGRLGRASAGVMADFILVDMVADVARGARTPKEAAERAAQRAARYYRT